MKNKKWYELGSNIGRPVWVKDVVHDKWNIDIFLQYEKEDNLRFICENASWNIAKPVLPGDCIEPEV